MANPKTILVPTDFSEPSQAAFPHARALAEAWGAGIVLLYVVQPPSYPTYQVLRMRSFPNLHDEMQKAAIARLDAMRAAFGTRVQVKVECREGRVFEQIDEAATEHRAGLVVIATHGHGGIKRALLGSNAERVVRTSSVPVVTIRAGAGRPALSPPALQRILVPTDLRAEEPALPKPVGWFASPGTELLFAHVIETPIYPSSPFGLLQLDVAGITAELRAEADQRMDAVLAEARAAHPRVRGTVVEGSPADQLLHLAEQENVDLIAMTTHGRTGLQRIYLGSVAEHVVRAARCPVLTAAREETEET